MNKNKTFILAVSLIFLLSACSNKAQEAKSELVDAIATPTPVFIEDDVQELTIEDIVVGEGAEVGEGDTVSVDYVGTLLSGEEFDSSIERGTPFEFTIGTGSVIQGWDDGVPGMKVGGKRKLKFPAELGYGEFERPGIPANSTLVFEIELLEIIQ